MLCSDTRLENISHLGEIGESGILRELAEGERQPGDGSDDCEPS